MPRTYLLGIDGYFIFKKGVSFMFDETFAHMGIKQAVKACGASGKKPEASEVVRFGDYLGGGSDVEGRRCDQYLFGAEVFTVYSGKGGRFASYSPF